MMFDIFYMIADHIFSNLFPLSRVILLEYDSLLMDVLRPGTSPSDIHAFTLDYHLQC